MQEESVVENAQTVNYSTGRGRRYKEFDYMKGILIILTVLGHINTPLTSWIYSFHMPVFFAISGYFWNQKHSESFSSCKKYILSRIVRLYIPFVIINILFILLNNVFLNIGFITNDPTFLELTKDYAHSQELSQSMSVSIMGKGIIKALLFSGGYAKLCGVTWFLSSLFFVSIIHLIIEIILKRLLHTKADYSRIRFFILFIILVGCLSSVYLFNHYNIGIPSIIRRVISSYAAYLCGVLIKEFHLVEHINYLISLAGFGFIILFGFLPFDTSVELSRGQIGNPICFVFLCICGFAFCFGLSKILSKYNIVLIKICGIESMSIMLLHCISFKIISLLFIKIYSLPSLLLAAYPAMENQKWFLPILYVLIGVVVPLTCKIIYNKLKSKLYKKAVN